MQTNKQPGSLSDKFQNYGSYPSDALWSEIESALDDKDKKRRGFIWWWVGGASAALLSIVVIATNFTGQNESVENQLEPTVVNQENVEENVSGDTKIQHEVNSTATQSDQQVVENSQNVNTADQLLENDIPSISSTDNQSLHGSVTDELGVKSVNQQLAFNESFEEEKKENVKMLRKSKLHPVHNECVYPVFDLHDIDKPVKTKRPWEIGFGISYWYDASQFNSNENQYYTSSNTQDPMAQESINGSNGTIVYGSVQKNINVSGFVGKYFTPRWSWRVGIDFARTKFLSVYSVYSDSNTSNTVLNSLSTKSAYSAISSLGIPVSAQFDMLQRPRFKLRGRLSLVNEIPIYEKYQYNPTTAFSYDYYKHFITGYLGAVQLGLSSDIKIAKNCYLSLTPAYRYYAIMKVDSQIPLVRKRHWLGGTVGLTWNL